MPHGDVVGFVQILILANAWNGLFHLDHSVKVSKVAWVFLPGCNKLRWAPLRLSYSSRRVISGRAGLCILFNLLKPLLFDRMESTDLSPWLHIFQTDVVFIRGWDQLFLLIEGINRAVFIKSAIQNYQRITYDV